jgi:hypothetical protein
VGQAAGVRTELAERARFRDVGLAQNLGCTYRWRGPPIPNPRAESAPETRVLLGIGVGLGIGIGGAGGDESALDRELRPRARDPPSARLPQTHKTEPHPGRAA